ncbi:MAG: hypothetical protein ACJAV4_000941 [Pontimonas sp.]|jgi:hypothetical protein
MLDNKSQKNLSSLPSNYEVMTEEERNEWTSALAQEILEKFRQQKGKARRGLSCLKGGSTWWNRLQTQMCSG